MNTADKQWSPEYELSYKRKRSSPPVSSTSLTSKRFKLSSPVLENIEETEEELAKQYKKFTNAPKYDLNSEEVFCICRKPDGGEIMIACDGCEEWFHFRCMNVNPELSHLISKFYCKFCKWKGQGRTQWKRKCRLEGCYEPIRTESKYCSEEHGKEFIRQAILGSRRSSQDLLTEVVKDVIGFVNGNHEKLMSLGSKFPEWEEVNQYNKDQSNLETFPEDVRLQLQKIGKRLENVTAEIDEQKHRMD